jgi:hypothetical protein
MQQFVIKEALSYDIRLHGARLIVTEFALATILGAGVTMLYSLYPHLALSTRLCGIFWLGLLLNFLTILLQSISLARHGVRREPEIELTGSQLGKVRRLTVLIGIVILVPFATLLIATHQLFRLGVR